MLNKNKYGVPLESNIIFGFLFLIAIRKRFSTDASVIRIEALVMTMSASV